MSIRSHCRRALPVFVLALVLPTFVLAQESDADLERTQRVSDLLRLLDAHPGASIADVGAGDGFFTVRIARAVAPSGRVAAVDISTSALAKLRERAGREGVDNIDVIVGAADDPHLAAGQYDAVLIHNAYHEMREHEAMLAHIRSALKPEGRLVLAEPMHDRSRGKTRDEQVAKHDLDADIAESELRAAGFEEIDRDNRFVPFKDVAGALWLIVARPASR